MKVFLGADHRGFQLKEELKAYLLEQGYDVEDVGASKYTQDDDYPDFAYEVAVKVAANPAEHRGILLCGSGMGMDVVANKVKGVRATVAYSRESTVHARSRDNINVISLAGDVLTPAEAKDLVTVFLGTAFEKAERDLRRLKKTEAIEEKNFRHD